MKFSKTYITPIATGATNLQESKDCVIRAITNVTGVSYDEVHSFLAASGRKQGKGTDVESMTVACKHFGRFIVVIRGHAVAMIDGKLIDTHHNPKQAQVVALFQFGDLPDSV